MGLLILLLFVVLLAAAGVLGFVVKVALGVIVGIVAAVVVVTWMVRRRIRRFLWGSASRRAVGRPQRWRQIPGSTVEVLDPHDPAAGRARDPRWGTNPPPER